MATSTDKTMQKYMDKIKNLKDDDENLEEKMNEIAQAIAAKQREEKQKISGTAIDAPTGSPEEEFQCEGCT